MLMFESVNWLADGSPQSPRFGERYHSCAGAVSQALNVYLLGCGMPQRWRGKKQFTVVGPAHVWPLIPLPEVFVMD